MTTRLRPAPATSGGRAATGFGLRPRVGVGGLSRLARVARFAVAASAGAAVLVAAPTVAIPAAAGTAASGSAVLAAPGATSAIGGEQLAEPGVVVAAGTAAPPAIDAAAYLVADLDTGEVLAAKAAHEPHLPASTLKILTALTLLPELDKTEVVVGTDEAAAVEGSKAGIYPGLKYSIDLVFKAMMMQSGNDAAVTLALAAGGVEPTVNAMNAVAQDLHALDTVVMNTSGLDAPGQVTSAYDLALITRAALGRDDFRAYLATETADMPDVNGATYQIQNENRFVATYEGAIGVKNGYTTLARHTYVGAAERDGRTLVVTLLRTEARPEPLVAALMDWGFANAADADPVGQLVLPSDNIRPTFVETPAASPKVGAEPADDSTQSDSDAARAGSDDGGGEAGLAAADGTEDGRSWLETVALLALGLATVVAVLRARVAWLQHTSRTRRPAGRP